MDNYSRSTLRASRAKAKEESTRRGRLKEGHPSARFRRTRERLDRFTTNGYLPFSFSSLSLSLSLFLTHTLFFSLQSARRVYFERSPSDRKITLARRYAEPLANRCGFLRSYTVIFVWTNASAGIPFLYASRTFSERMFSRYFRPSARIKHPRRNPSRPIVISKILIVISR